ncbi:VOC family protein [Galactobacter valiniphilus]|uniref:VOC family protein n=1 Tax=Galactobacter valiniphilus TaxID=2676122 RepID=UPI003736F762
MAEQKITPSLWFDGVALEAVEFYVSVFPDSEILQVARYPEEGLLDFQKHLAGQPLSIQFSLRGVRFDAINAGPEFKFNEAISLIVDCADQAEIDRYWEALSAVPESEQCGWLKDKYGLSWQIVPENMGELMASPGAFERMMSMKKLDIEGLRGTGA